MPSPEINVRRTRVALVTGLCITAVLLTPLAWKLLLHPGVVSTDAAQIDGHVHPINTRVAGTITWVNPDVEDTHSVKAGTILAHLDTNDYKPAVDRLEGDAAATQALERAAVLNVSISSAVARSRLSSSRASLAEAQADLRADIAQKTAAQQAIAQAAANYRRAEDDRVRYSALLSSHEISRSEYDQRFAESKATEAIMLAAEANSIAADERIESARQKISQRQNDLLSAQTAPEVIASAKANVQRALGEAGKSQAALWNAKLDLGYTDLIAPVDGIVGRKSMEVGQRVAAGQLMLTLAPPNDVWAIANFRETQLRRMRVGQTACIHVDALGRDLGGTVESIGGATGSKYAVLAPENATGNFVKVVQRIPVRIRIDNMGLPDHVLLPGMSIEVSVKVKN